MGSDAIRHRQGRLILVNINPGYRAAELEYALNKVSCRALITSDQFRTTHYIDILRELAPELAHCAPGALAVSATAASDDRDPHR